MISLGDYQKILKESRFKCWILENFLQPIMHEMANTIRAILQGVFFFTGPPLKMTKCQIT